MYDNETKRNDLKKNFFYFIYCKACKTLFVEIIIIIFFTVFYQIENRMFVTILLGNLFFARFCFQNSYHKMSKPPLGLVGIS